MIFVLPIIESLQPISKFETGAALINWYENEQGVKKVPKYTNSRKENYEFRHEFQILYFIKFCQISIFLFLYFDHFMFKFLNIDRMRLLLIRTVFIIFRIPSFLDSQAGTAMCLLLQKIYLIQVLLLQDHNLEYPESSEYNT